MGSSSLTRDWTLTSFRVLATGSPGKSLYNLICNSSVLSNQFSKFLNIYPLSRASRSSYQHNQAPSYFFSRRDKRMDLPGCLQWTWVSVSSELGCAVLPQRCWRGRFPSTLLGSSGWPKNSTDMKLMNIRKSHKSLIRHIHGRDPGKISNSPNGWNPYLKYHLQLKTKEDVGVSGLGLQKGWEGNWPRDGQANVW